MTIDELGQQTKAKYPQYKDLPDAEVGQKVLQKYPQYQTQITSAGPQKSILQKIGDAVSPQNQVKVGTRLMGVPSEIYGGAMKGGREYIQQNPGKIYPVDPNYWKAFVAGSIKGPQDRTAVMTELPKTVGVDPNSALGLGIGLSGELLTPDPTDLLPIGKAGEKITEKAGQEISKVGDNLVLRGLKPSPSQLKKFEEKTGVKLSDFLASNGIVKDFTEQAAAKIGSLQDNFDQIALNEGTTIAKEKIAKDFGQQIEEMSKSVLPEMKGKAESLKAVMDNLLAKYGDNISVADLTKERRGVDALIKESAFGLPPEQATYLRTVRNVLQGTIQDATEGVKAGGKSLKELGQELRKFHEFEKIATQQAGKGKGANIIGLLNSVATGAGGVIGGAPGAVAGFLMSQLSQSPTAIGTASKGIQGISDMVRSRPAQVGLEAVMKYLKELPAIQERNSSGKPQTVAPNPNNRMGDRFDSLRRVIAKTDRYSTDSRMTKLPA